MQRQAGKAEYLDRLAEIGAVYKRGIGATYPAMSRVQVSGLIEAGAKLEIEATAVVPAWGRAASS